MREVKVHGVLFVLAVLGALATWNRDAVRETDRGLALAWERDSTDVVSVHFQAPAMDIEIQRRTDEDGAFFWAREIRGTDIPDTLEFPVGAPGHALVARLATLRAIRDLGTLSPELEARYGLAESAERITVEFRDERRELLLGDLIYGGSDRYAVESATGTGYVIPSDIVNPLRTGEGAIRERFLHHFLDADVAFVRISAEAGERTMTRGDLGEWTDAGAETPDPGFANFMERVGQLAIAGYGAAPPLERVRLLLRVEYVDDNGDVLGFVELLKDEGAERDPYYTRSETTRILARALTSLAERVDQGLGDVF